MLEPGGMVKSVVVGSSLAKVVGLFLVKVVVVLGSLERVVVGNSLLVVARRVVAGMPPLVVEAMVVVTRGLKEVANKDIITWALQTYVYTRP